MRLDVNLFQAFVAIAEEGSVTSASIRLNRAQPWVSRQLKDLEESLGVELYVNRARGQLGTLSTTGKELLPIARRLVRAHFDAADEIRTLVEKNKRKLVLGIEPISLFIPRRDQLVNRLLSEQGLDLEIVTRTPGELIEGLGDEAFDVILTGLPVGSVDVDLLEIHSEPMVLAIPKSAEKEYPRGKWDGIRVLTMPETFHFAHHWWVKKELERFNVEWIDCPEASFDALMRFAQMMGLATLVPDFSANIPALRSDFVLRQIPEPKLIVRWALMKRHGHERLLVRKVWRIAKDVLRGA